MELKKNKKNLVIIGAGGHAESVASIAELIGYRVSFFIDNSKAGQSIKFIPVLSSISEIENPNSYSYAIAIGDNYTRKLVLDDLKSTYGSLYFPKLIHPSAIVPDFISISDGTVMMPKSVVGPGCKIGDFCILNTGSILDHGCIMSGFSSLAPSATIGGNVSIGNCTAISIGASIRHGLNIGSHVVVGGGSYLHHDLPDCVVAYGSPARIIRKRNIDDYYL